MTDHWAAQRSDAEDEFPEEADREQRIEDLRARLSGDRRAAFGSLMRQALDRTQRRSVAATSGMGGKGIPRRTGSGPAVLSFGQRRLWFLDRLEPGSSVYNLARVLSLAGRLDVGALASALARIVQRHESLRTVFGEQSGEPVQSVLPPFAPALPVIDLRGLPVDRRQAAALRGLAADAARPFDLARGPLLRALLVRLDDELQVLLVNLHHIVSDGWSLGVLVRESAELYAACVEGRAPRLPELPVQYADFAVWQQQRLRGEALEAQLRYWREALAGAPALLDLPTDRPRPAVQSYRGGMEPAALPPEVIGPLAALARGAGATLFMAVLAGLEALFHRYTGQEDVVVGTPVANRTRVELEGLIGFFVNTLALRGRISEGMTWRDLLERAREAALGAYAHQDLPFERLVEELGGARSLAHSPIFQVMLAWQNMPAGPLRMPGLTLVPVPFHAGTSMFDFTLSLWETGEGGAGGELEYATDLFDRATMRRLLGHLRAFLEGAVADPDARVADLPLLTEAERAELAAWNRTEVEYPDVCLHELIETQVERTPDAVAVVFEGESLTYRELDGWASALAAELPATLVGISVERSLEMVVGLVAILKAGGAYVPIDPGYPAERVAYMVEDSGVAVLLTREDIAKLRGRDESRPYNRPDPDSLAYMIYTSGSTGRPKGALNSHRGIVNRILWMQQEYGLTPNDAVLQKTPFSFDVSVWEFFWPLITGARLVVARPGGHQEPAYLVQIIRREAITTLHFVPSMLQVFVEQPGVEECTSLRRVMASGEALPADLAKRFFARLPRGVELHNLYGPTEAAVDVTYHACRSDEDRVPIGRPVANTRIHIFDREGNPVPVGIAGELHIAGVQVGRGYLHRPDLTAERFVPDPGPDEGGARIYRTGDLARWLADGEVEYLGRIDHQVKIRGFRIELGEIEAALARHPDVREAVVLAREQSLAAYVAPQVSADLRAFLRGSLPEHMIPSAFAFLDAMPLTPNGKVDRKALAQTGASGTASSSYVAPRTAAEEWLAAVWSELLGVERIGAHDSFFDLGGHSLLAVRVLSRVRDAFGVELPLKALFESPTLAGLAARLGSGEIAQAPPIRRRADGGPAPLSFGQERLWFLDRLEPGSAAYNIPGVVRLAGRLDVSALAAALGGVVRRHEALRTVFSHGPGGLVQEIVPEPSTPLPVVDLRALPAERRSAEARRLGVEQGSRPFDLARGPLLRTLLLRLDDAEHVFALTLHHIVADGWSVGVLVRELAALYQGRPLAELPIQYPDYAAWQRDWLRGEALTGELAWWRDRLSGVPDFLPLPADRVRPPVQRFRGGAQRDRLPAEIESGVQLLARREGATPFMVLLAAFDTLLARYTGQEDLVVGTPVAGRDRAETEGLIGLFLNTLALRVDLSGAPGFRGLLGRVREATLEAFAHGSLPFEKLVGELAPERDLSHAPIFQVLFVLQNTPDEPLELPGLTLSLMDVDTATSKFDLVLNASETGDGLSLLWMFNRDLFDASRIARLRGHFAALLRGALTDPGARLDELPLLTAAEGQQLLEWNATANDWAPEPSVPDLIGAQAARTPDAVALSFEGATLTYAELWERAGRLAAHLDRRGVGLDDLVGISAERSLELVVGLLGILRAGAAYVPIDPGYPADRVAFMVEDSGVSVLLDEASIRGAVGRDESRPYNHEPAPDSAAYMIYTSGSTGRPKGAINSHRAIRNRLLWMQEAYGLTPDDRVLQKTPFSFDVSVWEFFWPLMTGARLVVARPGGHQDPAYLAETIRTAGITTIHFVPSMLRAFLEDPGAESCASLRRVICSGEALPADLERRFFEVYPQGSELHNLYGPTEAAVDVTAWACGGDRGSVPIGRPIANTAIHIVDPSFRPVPVGIPGELLIGGVQPARGYHRRPGLTAERFIPGPAGTRLYRTGDLARWRPDGAIEYLGRIDFQVKIRGLRIELGEIEAALAAHSAVKDVVVTARDSRLVAYVVGDADPEDLRRHLAASLPETMVPSAFVFLDAMPLSPNGKVDRKALPNPGAAATPKAERVSPRTPLERFLAGLWSEALEVDSVGIHDSFFELGGNSISGAVLVNRLQRELGEIVHVVVIFDAPTVAKMADHLAREHRGAVVRLWGPESLGETSATEETAARVDDRTLAEFRGLVRPLAPAVLSGKNRPAVFVLSPPRSGSTLLRVMLGGHPKLFSPPELELLSYNTMGERRAAYPGRDSFWLEGAIRAVMEARECGPEEAKAEVEAAEREDWTTQRFYAWLQERIQGRLLADKTPSYALDPAILERAEAAFDRPFYIHLIRHPYGMIRSFEEAKLDQLFFRQPHGFPRRTLAELIWLASHRNVAAFLAGIPSERQHWVRFEELVRDPEGEMRRACAFLGIDYHPDMADPYKDKSARMTDGLHADSRMLGDVKFHQHRGVDASAAESWRALAAEHSLGEPTWETAVALGYERLATGLAPIVPRPVEPGEPLPLSFAQERLWFLDRLVPGSALYNIPAALRLDGDLDEAGLERTLETIVRRHAVLRATFGETPEGPVQTVHETGFRLPRLDLSALPGAPRNAELRRLAEDEARRPFDLARGPLFRAVLIRLEASGHALLVTMHHIVSDGWSIGLLVREAAALYTGQAVPELPVQYPDFARWQRQWLQGEALERQITYWREALDGAAPLDLPADRPRPAVRTPAGGLLEVRLPAALRERAEALARARGASLFMVLLAAFQALLHRLSAQDDLTVGTPVAGRNRAEIEPLIGLFVNTLVLRSDASGDPSFDSLVGRTRARALGAFAHQDVPFERLVEELAPERDLARPPLFQVMFALQNAAGDLRLELPGVTLSALPVETGIAKFDLTLSLAETPAGLRGGLEYSRDLFDRPTVARLAGWFETLLAAALDAPGQPLSDLRLLTEAEARQVLIEWNLTEVEIRFEPVHRQVEAHASAWPGAPAVMGEHGILTYGELNRRANRLAHRLRRQGVGPEDVVALRLPRSPELVTAALAALKAGAAYLPIDPAHPGERAAYIVRDSGARLLIETVEATPDEPETDLDLPLTSDRLAYVIYTSGSTGEPKGTELLHGGLANLCAWHRRLYGLGPDDRSALVAGPGFDASVWEMWPCLTAGATLCIPPADTVTSPPDLAAWLAERRITVTFLPTPLAEAVLGEVGEGAAFRGLRAILTGGDRLHRRPSAGAPFALVNHYGPTECTVVTTAGVVDPGGDRLPAIGHPIDNTRVAILDRALRPVPAGVPGELCVSGASLARGYRNRPALTAEKLVPDPHGRPGDRMYRTGDLARWLPDGEIEFLGRIDHQVKIRGVRIEPGEIEAALARHPDVREAAVLVREGRLVAYVVTSSPIPLSPLPPFPRRERGDVAGIELPGSQEEASTAFPLSRGRSGGRWERGPGGEVFRAALAARLPDVMVPSGWVFLDALPLTPNGKVDRRALERIAPAAATEEEAGFRTPTQELLAGIWSSLLGAVPGPSDGFFAVGGHSLMAARLVARVRDLFGAELPLRAVFEEPTLAGLAARIDRERGSGVATAPPVEPRPAGPVPLSFAQERLWFLDRLEAGASAGYTIAVALRIRGDLRPDLFEQAVNGVVRRHEALRTTFATGPGGSPEQVVAPALAVAVPVVDLSGLGEGETEALRLFRAEAARGFDLQAGPLLRPLLVKIGDGDHRALLTLHHIVADGWSAGILVREIADLYQGLDLAPLPVQYGDYALWQRRWLSGETLARQIAWWTAALAGAPTVLDLPADRPRPPVLSFRGGSRPLEIDGSLTGALRDLGRSRGATLFMTLLAGFDALLQRYTGQEDLLVGSPVANRPRAELETLVGLFVNTLVLRGRPRPERSFGELLEEVRGHALDAYAHQDLPFERLVEELRVERSLARTPLHQVVFALQNNPAGPVAVSGLVLEPLAIPGGTAKTDLLLSLAEEGERLTGGWEYSSDLFDASTIDRLSGHLRTLLEGAAADPGARLGDLPLLTGAERHQLLEGWNDTARPMAAACLHTLFEARVLSAPDAVAAVFEGESLTYAELDARADRLARRLAALGAGPETLVAICEPESLDRLVAVVGAFKAGAGYLPLDPTHPADRLRFMLEDSGARFLLARKSLLGILPEGTARLVLLDELDERVEAPLPRVVPDNLAYVIYTSGSTGQPNGVLVSHGAAAHLVRQAVGHFEVEPGSRVLQVVSFSFDASVLETWMALVSGATLCIGTRESRMSGEALAELIRREAVTTAVLTPAGLGGLDPDGVPSLRVASVGGDRCPAELASRWAPPASGLRRLLNCYGPTEAAIYATLAVCRGAYRREPPIGRPVANVRAHVLDARGRLAPVGVPGELCLGGDGLARGYLARPALTAERFVPDPFGAAGERLYRTGDLVRRLPDGDLEFLGRVDGQVKIRGLRIEVGEIEAALGSHPAVAECAVLVRDSRLVAYVVASPSVPLSHLRDFLQSRLPEYMVPGSFRFLESLPLGPTGKVDRGALRRLGLAPDLTPEPGAGRLEARDTLELELLRIWESVLGASRLGVRDGFFEAGGHSLLAVRLVEQVRQRFGRDLPLSVLFQGGTVEAMAALLREDAPAPSCLVPIQPGGSRPPFFCVHPAGGDVLGLAALARSLGPDQPFYGLQSRGLAADEEPLTRIEDMARLYLEEVRRVQPAGPYRLGGWSLGALIAFEMARQLREAGDEISLLAVLDSSPDVAGLETGEDPVSALVDIGRYVERLWGRPVGLEPADLEGLDVEAGLERLLERLRLADLLPTGSGVDPLRRILRVYQANTRAARLHVPGRYPGRVTLFRAADGPG
ncbi:MAG TPA: amino acid adenylation domain-containing protein, partial [Thermoanaerobaculia bacterium]|nr:amino acid adenylation domain-containing protein [Thermoanaerobaculia bacterium]